MFRCDDGKRRHVALMVALASIGTAGHAEADGWAWRLQGPTVDPLVRASPLADGGAIVSGTTWSWGAGLRDAALVRVDASGSVAWQAAVGTAADEEDPIAAVDELGSTCLTIGRQGIARLRPDGTLAWAARLSAPVLAAVPASSGGCIVGGDDAAGAWAASLGPSGGVAWSRRFDVPPPCASSASGVSSLAGLGALSDGRVVAGLLDEDPGACSTFVVEILDGFGTTVQRALPGAGSPSSWGSVRVDPGDVIVTSLVLDLDGRGCLLGISSRAELPDGSWGLQFDGSEDGCVTGSFEGVIGLQAWGRRVATLGHAGDTWSVQAHDDAGAQLWSRESFDGRIRSDGTFVAVTPRLDGNILESRGADGGLDFACVRSPAAVSSTFQGRDSRWPADTTPDFAHADAGVTAAALGVTVSPAALVREPACGACTGSIDMRDDDLDGIADACDACPGLHDPAQDDRDGDGTGAACDDCTDVDGDGLGEPGLPGSCSVDACPTVADPSNVDSDADGIGDACEPPGPEPSPLDLRPDSPPLLVRRDATSLLLTWEDVGATSYALRRGTIAALVAGSYDDEAILCGLPGPAASAAIGGPDAYFLAVSEDGGAESSHGRDSDGVERPAGTPCP